MLTCLVDGYYNYSKKKSVPSLFGSMDFEDGTKVDVMFKSSCQLEMRSSASRFFQEPRLTPNLMMDCAQVCIGIPSKFSNIDRVFLQIGGFFEVGE
jgi:hypothetical protein